MYTMYADKRGWQTEVMSKSETELGGYKEIVFRVAGDKCGLRLKFESGVHRVQRVPETESQGRTYLDHHGRGAARSRGSGFLPRPERPAH